MKDALIRAPFVRKITKDLTEDESALIAAAEMPTC